MKAKNCAGMWQSSGAIMESLMRANNLFFRDFFVLVSAARGKA
jgi:hypothetical protein